jgi:hypothetical protein
MEIGEWLQMIGRSFYVIEVLAHLNDLFISPFLVACVSFAVIIRPHD